MPKCPLCGNNRGNKEELIKHIEHSHSSSIPENMTTAQYLYSQVHGREYGICRVCGKPTEWNEKTGKPMQHCGSDECRRKIRETAQERMLKVYGKVSLMNDIKHQEKMLANRKISGTYTWSDGKHQFTYIGKYEKFAIEWLDKVMDLDPEHIQMPGPIVPYKFNGEIKYWITDIYLEDFNLIIEIKAGEDENTHPGFAHNRDLEHAKDASMKKQNQYNYTKITHKSMMKLIPVLALIRKNNIEKSLDDKEVPIIAINESTTDNINELAMHNVSNKDISSICDSIMNEYTMSIGNINPILGSTATAERKPPAVFDGESLIARLKKIKTKNEDVTIDPQSSIYSDRHEVDAPDPLVSDNNFISNEEIITDIETDPYDTRENTFAELSQSNVSSNFIVHD